ncbi:MAG: hypothetical protein WC907_07405 [Acholeplasmataceae bacterium]|jgi:hypothetical protein
MSSNNDPDLTRHAINVLKFANKNYQEAIEYAEAGDMRSMVGSVVHARARLEEIRRVEARYSMDFLDDNDFANIWWDTERLENDLFSTLASCKCDCSPIKPPKEELERQKEHYRKFSSQQLEDKLDYLSELSGEWEGRIDPRVYAISEVINERADAVTGLYDMRKYKKAGTSPYEMYPLPRRELKKPVLRRREERGR